MNVSSFRQSFDRSWARLVGGQGGVEGEKDVAPESHVKIKQKKGKQRLLWQSQPPSHFSRWAMNFLIIILTIFKNYLLTIF